MEEKVPKDRVLDDMYNPNGGMPSIAARDYYYENYATDEEKAEMDAEDKKHEKILFAIVMVFCAIVLYVAISLMFFGGKGI